MTARRSLDVLLTAAAAISLCACTTTPRSDFAWDLRDTRPHRTQVSSRGVVEYGPRSVTLPAVAGQTRRTAPAAQVTTQRLAEIPPPQPQSKPQRRVPAWYAQTQPQTPAQARPVDAEPRAVADNSVRFQWPLKGRIVSDYGTSGSGERNDGINIAVNSGTPVHASASGTVSYCGNELKGFGNLVLIKHDNGYITAYAHVGNIIVSRGDSVLAGQVIATSGATGDVASPQLHFEIRGSNQRPVNPKQYLPTLVAANS